MKQFLITSLALALSGGVAMAQYADDPYTNSGSSTQNESRRSSQQQYQQPQQYQNNGYADNEGYYDEYGDGYIDYDDDSYTTRFRRFGGVYSGYNYWSPAFSPYWATPVYMDPWFYSPYRMGGWGVSFGYGFGSPYWSSGWGMCNWWGFSRFSYWNNPYNMGWGYGGGYGMGWGYGYGNGYWNGYNDGMRNNVNYGPRRSNSSIVGGRTTGGVRPNPNTPGGNYRRRDGLGVNTGANRATRNGVSTGNIRERGSENLRMDRGNVNSNRNMNSDRNIRIDNNSRRTREIQGGSEMRVAPNRQMNASPRQSMPSRDMSPRQSAPRQSFERSSSPQPSRSYSAPAPSRSSGSFNSGGGGGSRSSGGGGGSRGGGSFRR